MFVNVWVNGKRDGGKRKKRKSNTLFALSSPESMVTHRSRSHVSLLSHPQFATNR